MEIIERPILMQAPMVRATLADIKTQTRRVQGLEEINEDPNAWQFVDYCAPVDGKNPLPGKNPARFVTIDASPHQVKVCYCPYGRVGEYLWVRENLANDGDSWMYEADTKYVCLETGIENYPEEWEKRNASRGTIPSIHMPRWASRILLEIKAIRVQRLQEISAADAQAEGATVKQGLGRYKTDGWSMDWNRIGQIGKGTKKPLAAEDIALASPQAAFGNFINVIHGGANWNLKPNSLWDQNPWVWVVEFKKVKPS